MPTDADAERAPDLLDAWDLLLTAVAGEGDLTDAEVGCLVALLPNDGGDCFGLAWTLVQLVESAPSWPSAEVLESAEGRWADILRHRAASEAG